MKFMKIASGPSSYSTGGFEISVGEFEKIQSAMVAVDPETLLGSYTPGLEVSLSGITATVKLHRADSMATWSETPANTDLSGAKFILTGDAI